jgi:hypothetical protein
MKKSKLDAGVKHVCGGGHHEHGQGGCCSGH